jgi:hypothetical protein
MTGAVNHKTIADDEVKHKGASFSSDRLILVLIIRLTKGVSLRKALETNQTVDDVHGLGEWMMG